MKKNKIYSLDIYSEKYFGISKPKVKEFVNCLAEELSVEFDRLVINFISSDSLYKMNVEYLNHKTDTDILTFSYVYKSPFQAELFISVDMAKSNSIKYKINLNQELIRLVIHGILHSIGYEDKTEYKKRKMKKIENIMVQKYLKHQLLNTKD